MEFHPVTSARQVSYLRALEIYQNPKERPLPEKRGVIKGYQVPELPHRQAAWPVQMLFGPGVTEICPGLALQGKQTVEDTDCKAIGLVRNG